MKFFEERPDPKTRLGRLALKLVPYSELHFFSEPLPTGEMKSQWGWKLDYAETQKTSL